MLAELQVTVWPPSMPLKPPMTKPILAVLGSTWLSPPNIEFNMASRLFFLRQRCHNKAFKQHCCKFFKRLNYLILEGNAYPNNQHTKEPIHQPTSLRGWLGGMRRAIKSAAGPLACRGVW